MNITILGATGRVGRHIAAQALQDGHNVRALARTPDKLKDMEHPLLTVVQGNVLMAEDIGPALDGSEAVISSLSTDGTTTLSEGMPLLIRAMEERGMKRFITVGTAGILDSRSEPGLLRYQSSESRRTLTRAAEEHHAVLKLLEQSALSYTIVCPTYLPDGPQLGVYRVEQNYLPEHGTQISVMDTAAFTYQQLFSTDFIRSRVGICY